MDKYKVIEEQKNGSEIHVDTFLTFEEAKNDAESRSVKTGLRHLVIISEKDLQVESLQEQINALESELRAITYITRGR